MSGNFPAHDRYIMASQEDRSAPRTRISIPATLRPSGLQNFQTVVQDLSLSGFSAMAINRMTPGSICWISIPGLEAQDAQVIWWNNSLVGCAFQHLLEPNVLDNLLQRFRGSGIFRAVS